MFATKDYYATLLITWLVIASLVMFLALARALGEISLTLS